jgi:uncharacterized protein YoxC
MSDFSVILNDIFGKVDTLAKTAADDPAVPALVTDIKNSVQAVADAVVQTGVSEVTSASGVASPIVSPIASSLGAKFEAWIAQEIAHFKF